MTVTLTSEAYGKVPGETYTGPEEAWLLANGYASQDDYEDPVVAVLTGTTDAVNVVTGGDLVISVDQQEFTVAIADADTPTEAAALIDTELDGVADAAVVSSRVVITSVATGSETSIRIVSGGGTLLANLGLPAGQTARGSDGGVGVANTGPTAVLPDDDVTLLANRENPPGYAADPNYDSGPLEPAIANLSADTPVEGYDPLSSPIYPPYDFDAGGVDDDPSEITSIAPDEGPAAGGTEVVLTGIGFEDATSVTFDGDAGTDFEVVSDYEIHVTTPAGTGVVDVVVVDPEGNGTLVGGFTYTA